MIEISGFFETQRTTSRHNKKERTATKPNSPSFTTLLDSVATDETAHRSSIDADTKIADDTESDILTAINDAKKDLLSKPTWKRAQKYREVVSSFLTMTTKKLLRLENHESAINGPNRKKFVIVRKVHAELDELIDLVLSSNSSALQILEKVGTIHGLLIDLKT